ncbi:hypothetical protein Leryth_023425 [Lithospermum erythrorhizon]|nr:hypothetical protein Leryth_023425 [Lithospermum erythrorhizon]
MDHSSIVQLQSAYDTLTNENTSKLTLLGDPGVGKTWMARMTSNRTVREGKFDFAIWVHRIEKIDKKTLRDVMMRQLSLDYVLDEPEAVDDWGATKKQNLELPERKILETLAGKKILFIVDNGGGDYGSMEELSTTYKASSVKFLITSTVDDPGCKNVIKVGPLSDKESLSWILEKVEEPKDEIASLATSFIEKRRKLPTDMIILGKIFSELLKNESGLRRVKIAHEKLQNVGSQESYVIEMLYKNNCLLPRNLLVDLCVSENTFLHRERLHYNELIAYWMLEESLGHFDCIENAYEKGHAILMELLNCGLIKELEDGYVVANKCYISRNEADSFLNPTDRLASIGTIRLGLRTVFNADFGRIVQTNGMMKTFRNGKEGMTISALLMDANRLSRDIPDFLHQSKKELELFVLFDPTFESLPLPLFEMRKLRLLVLRGCTYLKSIDETLESVGQPNGNQSVPNSDHLQAAGQSTMAQVSDASKKTTPTPPMKSTPRSSLQWLTVLEISGPSSLKSIPDDSFTFMPSLRSINLSHLDIKELPSTFFILKDIVCLILQGCSCLVELQSLENFVKLQVLDLSGATSFSRFHDRNFSANKELGNVNLSGSRIKSLPMLHHLENLKYLLLKDCTELRRLPKISALSGLEILDLSGATSFEVFHEPSLGELDKLKVIRLSQTAIKKLPLILGSPDHLSLRGCTQLRKLSFIEPMKGLLELDLSDCSNLEEINETFFSQLTSLQELNFSGTKVETLPSFASLTNLHQLSLTDCHSFRKLEGLNSLSNLAILDLSCSVALNEVQSLGEISSSSILAKLDVSSTKINSLPSLSNLANLRELILKNCTELVSLPSLEALSKLKVLNLSGSNKLESIGAKSFDNMPALQILDLSDTRLKQLPSLSNLKKLNYLSLRNCNSLTEDPEFGIHPDLEVLDLSGSGVKHLPAKSFANLVYLNLENCPNLDKFHVDMDEIFPPNSDRFPYEILSLDRLKLLVLPLLEGQKANQEKLVACQWQLSFYPDFSADNTLQISMSSTQFLQISGENKSLLHRVLDNYRSVIHPVDMTTRYGNEHQCGNQVVLGESLTQNVVQDIRRKTLMEEKRGSLEARDFDFSPEGIGSALDEAKHIVLISISILRCLTDFGSENFKEMELCWVENCSNLESLLPVDEEKNLGTTVDSNKDGCEKGESEAEIASASDSGSISRKMMQSCNFENLKSLHLEHCPMLSYIGCSFKQVANLEVLQIKHCNSLKTLFQDESAELPRLQKLHLWGLPEMNNISCKMRSISTLDIGECPKLEHIITSARTFEKLKILRVRSCDNLKSIFSDQRLTLPESLIWYLCDLPDLVHVGGNPKVLDHLRGCPRLFKKLPMVIERVTNCKDLSEGILNI